MTNILTNDHSLQRLVRCIPVTDEFVATKGRGRSGKSNLPRLTAEEG